MKSRIVRIAAMAALAMSVVVPTVMAKGSHDRQHLYRDCAVDGRIDGSYKLNVLRQGLRALPDDLGTYSRCPRAMRAHIVKRGGAPSEVVLDAAHAIRECAREGVLHPGHTPGGLRRTLRTMPTDVREYTP